MSTTEVNKGAMSVQMIEYATGLLDMASRFRGIRPMLPLNAEFQGLQLGAVEWDNVIRYWAAQFAAEGVQLLPSHNMGCFSTSKEEITIKQKDLFSIIEKHLNWMAFKIDTPNGFKHIAVHEYLDTTARTQNICHAIKQYIKPVKRDDENKVPL